MADNVVTTELEVRWGECDPAGIVYHPAYIDWFTVARMGFIRAHGMSYMKDFQDHGLVLVVLSVACEYRKVLRAEDRIRVEACCGRITRTRMTMLYRVLDEEGSVCAEGRTEHAFVDLSHKPVNAAKVAPELWERLVKLPVVDGQ